MVTYYEVKKGDTLSKIAQKFKVSVSAIQKANASLIKDVNVLGVGWVIGIPTNKPSKDYEAIGKQIETCLNDIEKLPSVQKLFSML